jgi:hypothetical protein
MEEIEVDPEVMGALKDLAEPFVDTPNSVLRRLLLDGGFTGNGSPRSRPPSGDRGGRASPGSILSEREYELPLLEELRQRGGRGPATEVTEAVGERLRERLTELDKGRLDSGEVRWRNRVHFTRLRLRKLGLLEPSRQRGVWELTERGREAAEAGRIDP